MADNSPNSVETASEASLTGRMLLSHNFTLADTEVSPLSCEAFATVFSQGLSAQAHITASKIDHPHWVVEVCYDPASYTAAAVGQCCAEALAQFRQQQQKSGFKILALGGVKTTPATSPPPALQTGEWGVDVVETLAPEAFLADINWDKLTAAKTDDEIFRVELAVGS